MNMETGRMFRSIARVYKGSQALQLKEQCELSCLLQHILSCVYPSRMYVSSVVPPCVCLFRGPTVCIAEPGIWRRSIHYFSLINVGGPEQLQRRNLASQQLGWQPKEFINCFPTGRLAADEFISQQAGWQRSNSRRNRPQ